MDIQTSRFGELKINDEDILRIKQGVLGFPEFEKFVILEHDVGEDCPFKWLQSVESADLAFVVVDPRLINVDYQLEIDGEVVDLLKSDNIEDYIPMVIVKIPGDDPSSMTANLRGPIIVHHENRQGCQIVLSNEDYAFDHMIFPAAPATAGSGASGASEND